MSTSPTGSTDVDTSDSEYHRSRVVSPSPAQPPSTASHSYKKRPTEQTPSKQVPSKQTSSKQTPSKQTPSKQPSSNMNLRARHAKAINPVVNSGQRSESTPTDHDEVIKSAATSGQTPEPTGSGHVNAINSTTMSIQTPEPTRPKTIPNLREMFQEVIDLAFSCRTFLKIKYQELLRFLDQTASHFGHLIEPLNFEAEVPRFAAGPTLQSLIVFVEAAERRVSWEIVKDMQETEVLIFQTLARAKDLMKNATPVFSKSEAEKMMEHFVTVNTTIDAFCTRMSARLTLTPEHSTIFSERDILSWQHICFRLAVAPVPPSLEERLRLLWAIGPIQHMRLSFLTWNQSLTRNNAVLKTMLETRAATISAPITDDEVRGLKRKAEDVIKDEQ